ncbi:MAG: hypothetical protein GF364_11475 [Candidatus Lokiarchaeota archaeon]|nr:hypothetical protein [Candidatus Lokiarchaeota archaeon]
MSFENRKCPYCNKKLNRPYWRHIQIEHPKKFEEDTGTWIQLFKDYRAMGMNVDISIKAICELFNRSEEEIRSFLEGHKVL